MTDDLFGTEGCKCRKGSSRPSHPDLYPWIISRHCEIHRHAWNFPVDTGTFILALVNQGHSLDKIWTVVKHQKPDHAGAELVSHLLEQIEHAAARLRGLFDGEGE